MVRKLFSCNWASTLSVLVIALSVFFSLAMTVVQQMDARLVVLLLLLPVGVLYIGITSFLKKDISVSLTFVIVFLFWLPLSTGLSRLASYALGGVYIFEFGVWALALLSVVNCATRKDFTYLSRLRYIPLFPFLVLILGAALAYLTFPFASGQDLPVHRITTVLPLLLAIAVQLNVKSLKNVELYMWSFLISGGVLAVLFLLGQRSVGFITAAAYAADMDRASLRFDIPFIGVMEILPQSAGEKFGFLFTLAYAFWHFARSVYGRVAALVLCGLFGATIVLAQGRTGGIILVFSGSLITLYSLYERGRFNLSTIIGYALIGAIAVGGFWFLALNYRGWDVYYTERIISLISDPFSDKTYLIRTIMWQDGLTAFSQHPLGVSAFGFTAWGNDTWAVHNMWIYLLLNYGLVGFIGFVWLLVHFLRVFLKGFRNKDVRIKRWGVIGLVWMVNVLISSIVSPIFRATYSIAILWVPIMLSFSVITLEKHKTFCMK